MQPKREGDHAKPGFAPGWTEAHLRTRHLFDDEAAIWARSGPLTVTLQG